MYGELLPKSVTRLDVIPNLLLSIPPPHQPAVGAPTVENADEMGADNENTEGAEFPNSVLDKDTSHVGTSHDQQEYPEYDSNLDRMLLQSTDTSHLTNSCPLHPGCDVNSTSGNTSDNHCKNSISTTLDVLKKKCNMNLTRLTDAEVSKWMTQTSDQETLSLDSDDNIPLSHLRECELAGANNDTESGFSSEDDIPLIDFNKPCMRGHTCKKSKTVSSSHLPCKSKTGISYEESELSKASSDRSPTRKKEEGQPPVVVRTIR